MNRPIIIYSVVALSMLLLWFFVAYAPQHIQHEAIQTQLTEARAKLADYHNTLVELQDITRTRDELSIQKNKLNSILYTKHNILNLFEHLEEQLSSKHLSLKEITPPISELLELNANVGDTSKPQFLTIMLRVEGNYIDFGRFVANLESSDYFRGVKRCQITNPPDKRDLTQFMIQFRALLGSFGRKS